MDQKQFAELLAALGHTKWTETVSTLVLIVSFIIAIFSLWYARKQMIADHTRSRRQLSIDMCMRWSNYTSPETSSVVRLVERMTSDQCEAISNATKLTISTDHKLHLLNILQLRFPEFADELEKMNKSSAYEIEGQYLQYIRHIAIRYLNMLESILLAWTTGVADQAILENEFAYLFDEKDGRSAMEGLRKKVGMSTFPAIEEFMKALRARTASGRKEIIRPPVT